MIYSYMKLGSNGRLGNQLFQIASTYGIATKNGGYPKFPSWEYQNDFCVPSEHFGSSAQGDVDFGEDYLQDYHNFDSCEYRIKQMFRPSQSIKQFLLYKYRQLLQPATLTQLIGVHVRRGDYVNLPLHHPVCSLEYYEKGIEYVSRLCAGWDKQLVVFSDDIEWCRQQELFKDAVFAEGNTPSQDLHLMSRCNAFVISNSTLSWWAAYLSGNQNVAAPTPWYGPALQHIDVPNTLILPTWKEIER